MKIFFSKDYSVDIGEHAFPTRKFALVADAFAAAGGRGPAEFVDPETTSAADLARAHTPEWVEKVLSGKLTLDEEMRMELPWSKELVRAHRKQVSGTYAAGREALKTGLGLHAGGGSHHAFADHAEGFCVFNDLACALIKLREEGRVRRAAVVDLDVHQGNGTAAILAPREELTTFSMHQEDIYPAHKPPSTLDIGLSPGTSDEKYLKLLDEGLARFLEGHRPELVLYQAGVDCWKGDRLGGLALTRDGVAARDEKVFSAAFERRIPVAVTLGGGYAERLEDTVGLHVNTLSIAVDSHRRLW